MILDHYAELTTATPFDLGAKKPGPGEPIVMYASGMTPGAQVAVATSATSGGAYVNVADATVGADGTVEFRLPSTTLQWIQSTFAGGALNIVMEGTQTAT